MRLLRLLALLLGTSCAAPSGTPGQGTEAEVRHKSAMGREREEIVPGHLLVELHEGVPHPGPDDGALEIAGAAPKLPPARFSLGGVGLRIERVLFDEVRDGGKSILLCRSAATDERGTLEDLVRVAEDPRVSRVEPDRVRRIFAVPNDPRYTNQWGLMQIHMPRAWDRTAGSRDVVVAILDTGIIPGHPDLAGRLVAGYDFITDAANAGDGDGRDPDPTDMGTSQPGSSELHGLHVAGIIGAASNNMMGVSGVDWRARLLPVRVLGISRGSGIDSDITDALRWAVGRQVDHLPANQNPAHIINLSFGGLGISFTVQRAVTQVIEGGALVVAASGNGNAEAASYSPGGLDGVITVGASTRARRRAPYSNHGPRVDLLAPGGEDMEAPEGGLNPEGIISTYKDVGQPERDGFTYFALTGTSQAAPHVSGAAALARAIAPVRQRTLGVLLRSSADLDPACLRDEFLGCGAGVLNVDKLLAMTSAQLACRCTGDRYCLDGSCIDPPYPHVSVFYDPVVRAGCSLARSRGAPRPPRLPLILLAVAWCARARRGGDR